MRRWSSFFAAVALLSALAMAAGCGRSPTVPTTRAPSPSPGDTPEVRYNTGEGSAAADRRDRGNLDLNQPPPRGGPATGGGGENDSRQRQKQMELLERIRRADPQNQTIERAFMNEDNDLGVILDRRVQMSDVPKLLRALLAQVAREFPNENLDVIAYAPSQPPLKIGTVHLDARTREMTYTAARR